MSDNTLPPPSGGPTVPAADPAWSGPQRPALLAATLIVAGSAVIGLAGGMLWAAVAPRVVYQVYSLNPPTAYAINPETSAFIAADGWYCFIALGGGALIGLLGYLFAVRRYGPVPMAGVVLGSCAAAFLAAWLGHVQSGGPGFDHLLATSKTGALLHAPISLGAHGALAFWPLAAGIVAGGSELASVLRLRQRSGYSPAAILGMPTFSARHRMPRRDGPGHRPPPAGGGSSDTGPPSA